MSIRYQISTWTSLTAPKAFSFSERQRLDAALDECWRQIFRMIEGEAGRDTRRAWTLKAEFDAFAAKLEKEGLRRGTYRHEIFYWRGDRSGEYVEYVEFWQQRI